MGSCVRAYANTTLGQHPSTDCPNTTTAVTIKTAPAPCQYSLKTALALTP